MLACQLHRVFRSVMARALPLGAVGLASPLLSGCPCLPGGGGPQRSEIRPIEDLPPGWGMDADGLGIRDEGGELHWGGPEDPDISEGECTTLCGGLAKGCQIAVQCDPPSESEEPAVDEVGYSRCDPEGTLRPYAFFVLCDVEYSMTCGRRPDGLAARAPRRGESHIAAYFAQIAHLEAASVDAFEILGSELAAHGAPRSLRRGARQAARDEVRHARVMGSFARRAGARIQRPRVRRPAAARAVLDIALENAREGCVRETYGALVALWQAEHARDPRVRAAFAAIAREEARHAALSWRVAAWAEGRLSEAERDLVRSARERTTAELLGEVRCDPPEALAPLGLPSARVAEQLLSDLAGALELRPGGGAIPGTERVV